MNDDLISRQDAIEEVKALPNTENGYSETYDKECFICLLKEMPTAEKRGKWVKADCQQYFRKHYPASQCSICGWRKNYSGKYNYCPNCGADMKGEEFCSQAERKEE